jgi:hypothetical protein
MKMHTSVPVRVPGRGATCGTLVLVAVALAAGCSGGSDAPITTDDGLAGGPLAELLGIDASPAATRARQLAVQQAIAQCMQSAGWEYQVAEPASPDAVLDEYDRQFTDPIGYGTQYGYGIVRGFELGRDRELPVDPNAAFVAALDDDRLAAYEASLYGDPAADVAAGCSAQAEASVGAASPLADAEISARLDELTLDAQSDPALMAAYTAWATCMTGRDERHDFTSPDDIHPYLYGELAAAQGFGGPSDTVDTAAIEALGDEERRIWADDQACQLAVDLPGVRTTVEQQIVEALLSDFPELGAR